MTLITQLKNCKRQRTTGKDAPVIAYYLKYITTDYPRGKLMAQQGSHKNEKRGLTDLGNSNYPARGAGGGRFGNGKQHKKTDIQQCE